MENKTQDKYTSLKLSKLLKEAGCELESEYCYVQFTDGTYGTVYNDKELANEALAYDILNDICVRYAKEFFGEEEVKITIKQNGVIVTLEEVAYEYSAKEVLSLLQQGKKQEAEAYIWNHTVFNPNNKGK